MPDAHDATPPPPDDVSPAGMGFRLPASESTAWVARSDQLARPILDLVADFDPENLAPLGVPGAAEKITRLPPDWPREKLDAYDGAIRELTEQQTRERHPALRLDLESMITFLGWEADVLRIETELMLPCPNLAETIVMGLHSLLAGQSLTTGQEGKECPAAVLRRLRRYAGLEAGDVPLAQQAEALIRARLGQGNLLAPWRETLLQDLRNGPLLLDGLPRLFAEHRITGHQKALDVLRRQLATYTNFLSLEVLPRCRDDFRLPPELYAARLARCGVELPIDELSHRAEAAFSQIRGQLEDIARRLPGHRARRDEQFPDCLRRLKRERLDSGEILDHYRKRCRQLERLIARTGFASPTNRRFGVRLASEAENAVLPFPHFRWPRHLGGEGQAGEIVLPLTSPKDRPADLSGDDYASRAVCWAMAVHEGLPGHGLQVARLLEPDVPLARGPLAFNYAGLEGWAVYAESEIFTDLPLEARFMALHSRLRQAAGAFLDPGLQQQRFTREQARHFLQDRVGLSGREAGQALWRYTAWSPGQATSYYCGHIQLAALRTAVECRLGRAFERRAYHDFLLAQGLLPLSLLRRHILEQLEPERRLAA